MDEVTYEILKQIAVFKKERNGWTKEVNLISWRGAEPKYDIRTWSPDHSRMGKGLTLSQDELISLTSVLDELCADMEPTEDAE